MILLVDDSKETRNLIKLMLKPLNLEIDEACDGMEALDKVSVKNRYELFLVDITMPNMDGIEFANELKTYSDAPIIFITAMSDERSKMLAYDAGAAWYIVKPFSATYLRTVLTRFIKKDDYVYENLKFNFVNSKLYIDGVEKQLTPKQAQLFTLFLRNKNANVTKEKIIYTLWGYLSSENENNIAAHIKKIRSFLEDYSKCLKTVTGVGYSWVEKE